MANECETYDCERAAEMGKDLCPLCQFRMKDGEPEFNALGDRL